MGDETVYHVYAAQEGGSIWSAVLQSLAVSMISVLTVSVLLGTLVGFLVLNNKWIVGMLMSKVLEAVLRPPITEDESENECHMEFGPCKPVHSHQDTPMPRLGFPELVNQGNGELVDTREFSPHENSILELLVEPSKIGVTWEDIAGSEELISSIQEQVIFPIIYSFHHDADALLMPPKGILLHGPPGCGKTLIAKALSSEIKAHFINFDISAIKNKWVGETEKMATALFSVARKLQPCIIFIDEVDSFLSQRGDGDQATEQSLKAIFLQQWDGLTTEAKTHVVVLAASNRLDSIDEAIQRRLPLQFNVPLPEQEQREMILNIILRDCDFEDDVDLKTIADKTEGFSGSDLQEVCRHAATYRLVEYYKQARNTKRNLISSSDLIENMNHDKFKLVDPHQIFQQFEQLSQPDLVTQDSDQNEECTTVDWDDSSDIGELLSCSSRRHSSFMHQALPSDIVVRLLKDELAACHDEQYFVTDQSNSFDQELIDDGLGEITFGVNREPNRQPEDELCEEQQQLMKQELQFQQQMFGQEEQQEKENIKLMGLSGSPENSSLRPISMADLLRALQYSRQTGQEEDLPDGMYN